MWLKTTKASREELLARKTEGLFMTGTTLSALNSGLWGVTCVRPEGRSSGGGTRVRGQNGEKTDTPLLPPNTLPPIGSYLAVITGVPLLLLENLWEQTGVPVNELPQLPVPGYQRVHYSLKERS